MTLSTTHTAMAPVIYGAAIMYSQMNFANAGTMPSQISVTPPGNNFSACVDFVFSSNFRKFINANNEVPSVTIVGEIGDYLSACICKIYNATSSPFKMILSSAKDTSSTPPKPPENSEIYSLHEIPPLFQSISNYFFNVFVPQVEKEKREPGVVGKGENYGVYFRLEHADTIIGIEPTHYYADGSNPAINRLHVDVFCRLNYGISLGSDKKADSNVINVVKDLCITYFKDKGAQVSLNDKPI